VAEPFEFEDGTELEQGRIVMPFTYAVRRRRDSNISLVPKHDGRVVIDRA